MVLRGCAVLLVVCAASLADGRALCNGDLCTSSNQCDRLSACYRSYTSKGEVVGRCYRQRYFLKHKGESCTHKGDCDACSECVEGVCIAGTERQLEGKLEAVIEQNKQLLWELGEKGGAGGSTKKKHHGKGMRSGTAKFIAVVVASCIVVACSIVVIFIVVVHRLLLRRRRRRETVEESQQEPPFEAPSDSDSEVDSETELLLRNETRVPIAEGAEGEESQPPATLDPDDPNTCKICFDSVINCILLDCGHMCVCMACAKRCKHCPMCRKLIRKRKRVFKS